MVRDEGGWWAGELATSVPGQGIGLLRRTGEMWCSGHRRKGHATPVSDAEVLRWKVPDLG